MLFDDADSELLKAWIIKKLADVSDADPDVLADYVLALVKTDEPESVAKANCVENLNDFMGDTSQQFVDDVFTAIATKAYNPSKPAVKAPAPASLEPPKPKNESRKRSYHDWDRDESQNGQIQSYQGGDRPFKQARRGRGGFDNRGGRQNQYQQQSQQPQMPQPPPGFPAFPTIDPNDPVGSMMAMQAFAAMNGLSGFGNGAPQTRAERCRDYDNKGFCSRGAQCPFEHGNDHLTVPPTNDQYDPNFATLMNVQPSRTGIVETSPGRGGRGGPRGRGGQPFRGGGKRADFSMLGMNHDRSITAIVVEQIPEDKFDKQSVRNFFGEFGNIEDVTMQPYKRLAIVKYDNYDSAYAAYNSPKVVFDNRFVKVYWYSPEGLPQPPNGTPAPKQKNGDVEMQEQEPDFDPEEVAKKQEEAQRKHDEQQKKRDEAEKEKSDIEAKVKANEAQLKKMMDAIKKKEGGKAASPAANGAGDRKTAMLEQLAKLEAEAESLGIDPEEAANGYQGYSAPPYPYRGRAGYRGRPRGRGGYNASFRGGWGGARGGAVKRLDNRPKTVSITFTNGVYKDHEEALRQWLLFNSSESTTLDKHPTREDIALVAFTERYLAENFMTSASAPTFPLAGKAELSWYKPDSTNATPDVDVKMELPETKADEASVEDATTTRETDADAYDVADEDHWG